MSVYKVHFCLIMLIVLVGLATCDDVYTCVGVRDMLQECEKYLSPAYKKIPPSGYCCEAVRGTDYECLNKYLGQMKKTISRDKLDDAIFVCNTPPRLHASKSETYKVHV
ncbi:hypothetical protein C5167_035471 [Papaver somniferum]|uniref:Bifunctional inhibitor/plant lipid transfer protein/seed storage helical domain-containing protein n=1 Tax=Papaver somniferum TaxID=3469 RepID=A0A4Y7KG22_PAPSO|nr:uncharacterized protein LOC113293764 [Papaver somniferum]RZC72323.1 hypothetical protein C5167_035471 [Papaver somniferum]